MAKADQPLADLHNPITETSVDLSARRTLLWALGVCAAIVLAGLPSLYYAFQNDQAIFAVIADRWNHGGLPYRDAFDTKPPGIYAIYAVAFRLFGRTMVAPRIADLIGTLLTALGLLAIVGIRRDPLRAAVTAGLFGVTYLGLQDWYTTQPEGFAAPAAVLMVYLLLRGREQPPRRRWWALAGLCLGWLVLLKTPFVLLGALVLFRSRAAGGSSLLRRVALFSAGAVLPIALTVGYFALHRASGLLIELLSVQMAYARGAIPGISHAVADRWTECVQQPALWLCVIPALVSLVQRGAPRRADIPLVPAWLALSFLIFAMQQRFPYQALPMLPPLAVLAGGPLADIVAAAAREPRPRERRALRFWGALALLVLAAPTGSAYALVLPYWIGRRPVAQYWARPQDLRYRYGDLLAVSSYVRARTRPSDLILAHPSEPVIYFLADRASPTRVMAAWGLYKFTQMPSELRAGWLAGFRRDIARRPPRYLVAESAYRIGLPSARDGSEGDTRAEEPARVFLGGHSFARVASFGQYSLYRLEPDRPGAAPSARDDFPTALRDLKVLEREAR